MDKKVLHGISTTRKHSQSRDKPLDKYPTFTFSGVHMGLRRLRLWVAAHGALQLTLKDAAEIACLEPHYLSRAFRRRVGQTFLEWTREYRLNWAIRAIKSGQYSIGEVSRMVGYRDRRSLERAVRAYTGDTPGMLQKKSVNGIGTDATM